ncbi:LIC_12616 family protein [Asaia sp. VD9]|uniref:phage neck terminator protein n=1 Tax=Asaia sp. VD9 TaxID=3081235 RepID=UPI00301906FD
MTSATGAVLPSSAENIDQDAALDLLLGDFVAAITGLPRDYVRRRWQPRPPKQPPPDTDWCALGVVSQSHDINAYQTVNQDGSIDVGRHETFELLASFYGPNGAGFASRLRDGLTLGVNRGVLQANGMAMLDIGRIDRLPSLVNQQWLPRTDIRLRIRRHAVRTYPLQSVLSSEGTFQTETTTDTFNTENAAS